MPVNKSEAIVAKYVYRFLGKLEKVVYVTSESTMGFFDSWERLSAPRFRGHGLSRFTLWRQETKKTGIHLIIAFLGRSSETKNESAVFVVTCIDN